MFGVMKMKVLNNVWCNENESAEYLVWEVKCECNYEVDVKFRFGYLLVNLL